MKVVLHSIAYFSAIFTTSMVVSDKCQAETMQSCRNHWPKFIDKKLYTEWEMKTTTWYQKTKLNRSADSHITFDSKESLCAFTPKDLFSLLMLLIVRLYCANSVWKKPTFVRILEASSWNARNNNWHTCFCAS